MVTTTMMMMRVVECCHFLPEFLHSFPGFQSQLLTTVTHYYYCYCYNYCYSLLLLTTTTAAAHCSQLPVAAVQCCPQVLTSALGS